MGKLLSIAIPTFNRGNVLKEELECILPQLVRYKELVEIVISDNASPATDNTKDVVNEMVEKYGIPIDYKKLDNAIYFEDNFKEVVSRTTGKYIHMTGDDDLFSPNFYDVVFQLLEKDYGLIHFNKLIGDGECSNTSIYDSVMDFMLFESTTEEFTKRVMRSPGFMTSLIFRKDCWDAGEKYEKVNYYGYHFLGRLYQGAISLGVKSCYYYMPMIIFRNASHDWGKMMPLFYYVGYSNIFKDTDVFVPGIYQKWLDFLHHDKVKHHLLLLSAVLKDKAFYLSKYDEMTEHLSNPQKRALKFLLKNILPDRIVLTLYRRFVNMYFKN